VSSGRGIRALPAVRKSRRALRWLAGLGLAVVGACTAPVERFLPTPIPVSYRQGLLSLVGEVRPEQDSRCGAAVDVDSLPPLDSKTLLLDVAAPLSVFNTKSGRRGQVNRHGQVLLSSFAEPTLPGTIEAPRVLLCDTPLLHSNLSYDDFVLRRGDPALPGTAQTDVLGAVIGADLLTRLSLRLRLEGDQTGGRGELLVGRSDVTPSCSVDAAVVPFSPLGGDLRVLVGDSVLAYPATRITVAACVEPLADPLRAAPGSDRPTACLSTPRIAQTVRELDRQLSVALTRQPPDEGDIQRLQAWLATAKLLDQRLCPAQLDLSVLGDLVTAMGLRQEPYEASGANMRFLLSTAVPDLILSESACLRLGDPSRCACDAKSRVSLRLPGLHGRLPGSEEGPTEDLACPLRLGSERVAALALMASGLHLSPCAELARSRRQRYALPKLDERERQDNDCEREACLQNLLRQSELALRRCGYTGMDLERACDDHLASVAAYVEIGGGSAPEPVDTVTALVVPDTSPILQSANIDLRNSAAQVDGVIGVSLLRRLDTVIDYPQHRLEWTCRCTAAGESGMPQRCQTYRGVSYSAADGCSPNSTLTIPRNFARTACN
jgi:hypothetical protein